jgi:hypothetical protein
MAIAQPAHCQPFAAAAAAAAAELDGSNLSSFLAAGRPEWSAVRWIVVDGVSGDVLQVSCLSKFRWAQ